MGWFRFRSRVKICLLRLVIRKISATFLSLRKRRFRRPFSSFFFCFQVSSSPSFIYDVCLARIGRKLPNLGRSENPRFCLPPPTVYDVYEASKSISGVCTGLRDDFYCINQRFLRRFRIGSLRQSVVGYEVAKVRGLVLW